MIALRNDLAQAALFHDRTTDARKAEALKVALRRVLERFTDLFGAELAALASEPQPSAPETSGEVRGALWAAYHVRLTA